MTYDEWKLRSDRDDRPEDEPARCIHLFLLDEHCPQCDEPAKPSEMTRAECERARKEDRWYVEAYGAPPQRGGESK